MCLLSVETQTETAAAVGARFARRDSLANRTAAGRTALWRRRRRTERHAA